MGKTYRRLNGETLVVSVDMAEWETITFRARDFRRPDAATAAEVAAAIKKSGVITASVDKSGVVILQTGGRGVHTSLEIDVEKSIAAPALGLDAQNRRANGTGLQAAQLVSLNAEPYAVARGAELRLVVDGRARHVVFKAGLTWGRAKAEQVVKAINARKPAVARVTRDGHIAITSSTIGEKSQLRIDPPPPGTSDAAGPLGFTGPAAASWPHRTEPARLVCAGAVGIVRLQNLTAGPVELHLSRGTTVLAARGSMALAPDDAGQATVQRLIQQGIVRLAPGH